MYNEGLIGCNSTLSVNTLYIFWIFWSSSTRRHRPIPEIALKVCGSAEGTLCCIQVVDSFIFRFSNTQSGQFSEKLRRNSHSQRPMRDRAGFLFLDSPFHSLNSHRGSSSPPLLHKNECVNSWNWTPVDLMHTAMLKALWPERTYGLLQFVPKRMYVQAMS